MSEPEVDLALKTLQELEPYGIFAPDLRHCLMKQLEMQGDRNSTAYRIVEEHLQDVADRKDQQYFQKHEAFYCRSTEMY